MQRLGALCFFYFFVCFCMCFRRLFKDLQKKYNMVGLKCWSWEKKSGLYAPPKLDSIPPELQRIMGAFTTPPLWLRRRRRHRKQKQGKRSGLRARLYANPHRPALPSLLLTNARSLTNKLDEIRLRFALRRMDSCVAIVTET